MESTQVTKAKSAQVKATVEKNEEVVYVDSSMSQSAILKADADGKKLIFDIVDFPELSLTTLGKMSRGNRMAYQMDLRYSKKADQRIADGLSPYSETKKRLDGEDPLGNITSESPFEVRNKSKDHHYLFPDPRHVDALKRAGYELVKPDGKEQVVHGVKKGDMVAIVGDSGKIDNVAMRVDLEKYNKHVEVNHKKSQARLGQHLDETKEKMAKYSSRVTIHDKSSLYPK